MNNWLWVFIGGGVGSIARYGISQLVQKSFQHHFPLATLLSNILSCIILVVAVNYFIDKPEHWLRALIITGICGGFSTFSTFSFETVELFKTGHALIAIANITISTCACIGIIYLFSKTTL